MTNFTASGHQLVTRQRNGKDGRSVSKVDVVYQRSTSATSVPTTWVTTAPKLPKGYYLWSAMKVTYKEADGKTTTEVIGAQCIASADNLKTTVERYAQTTSRTTPPDNSSSAWQEGDTSGVQAKDGYYTWTQTKIVWQDGTITYTTPICITGDKGNTGKDGTDGKDGKDGTDGADGLDGCILRTTEWASGIEFHNDEGLNSGTRFLDIAVVTESATSFNAYKCLKTHVSSSSNAPQAGVTTEYWEPFNSMVPIYTPMIMAQYALLRLAQTNQLLVMKADGTTVNAGMGGGNIPLWVGNNEPIKAPFYVDANGHLCATGAKLEGEVNATSGTFKNVVINGSYRSPWQVPDDSLDTETTDNIALISNEGGGWTLAYSLKWDASQSGRILRITNYKWKNDISTGYSSIAAPSGKYFFEDGIAKNELKMSREVVELLGYGDENNFYGWIILKRNDLMTNYAYGSPLKCVAFGRVTGTDSSALIQQSTFDGKAIEVERQGTGTYKLTMPTSWFASQNSMPFIMVCGYGTVYNGDGPQKATVRDVTATTFLVDCSDDASRNDGSFQFMIYNQYMWDL
jgi:hypothetical protein